jgi:ABC-type branched-subunit amino acid transport system ATPase component
MLVLDQVVKNFGGVCAVDNLSFKVEEGNITALIGPNGSGKSTTLNLITSVHSLTSGAIRFQDRDISRLATHRVIRAGIARTFQNIRVFDSLTVWENLWVAAKRRPEESRWKSWFTTDRSARAWLDEVLKSSHLSDRRDVLAGNLSLGEARRLEVARGMATDPKLLMLDEPAAGMYVTEIAELVDTIRTLRDNGTTILLIDHVLDLVMTVAHKVVVLNFGQKLAEGTPAEVQADPNVRAAYLGTKEDA